MKKLLLLLAVVFLFAGCNKTEQCTCERVHLSDVALDGGIIVEKYAVEHPQSGKLEPQFKMVHILSSYNDTLIWYNVPLEIYVSFEVGDTIWPLREK